MSDDICVKVGDQLHLTVDIMDIPGKLQLWDEYTVGLSCHLSIKACTVLGSIVLISDSKVSFLPVGRTLRLPAAQRAINTEFILRKSNF